METMKKYVDIVRANAAYLNSFEVGEPIVIEEKINGANFSFRYDEDTDTVKPFARGLGRERYEVNFKNSTQRNLSGLYERRTRDC